MDDPTLEETGETVEEFMAELDKLKEKIGAMTEAERDVWYAEARELSRESARQSGAVIIDSEDHPMHPRNVHKRRAERGIFWEPPKNPPRRTI